MRTQKQSSAVATEAASDQDNAWKELLDLHFREFMEFFFPTIAAEIDWTRKPVFLDKELPKLEPANTSGARIADKLAQVWRLDGGEIYVMLHSEIQGRARAEFNRRMYVYNYRISDRDKAEVVSLGVVTGSVKNVALGRYETERWGCRVLFEFPVVKITDWRGREAELERSRNPFALVVLAQLKLLAIRGQAERKYAAKRDLMLLLLQAGYNKAYIRSLLRFLDWVIRLPKEVEAQLNFEVEKKTKGKTMPYITSWERRGMERGEKVGEERGEKKMVIRLLAWKFGELETDVTAKIEQLPATRLNRLAKALLKFTEPADLTRWLDRNAV
jgi:hypothetical protein